MATERAGGGRGPADWDERYRAGGVWSQAANGWVVSLIDGLAPGTAVDLGAGEGRNSLELARRGWRVTAVDFSAEGLTVGRRRAEGEGLDIEWVTADATLWSPRTPVDLVLLAYLQLPRPVLEGVLRRASGWLGEGGTAAVLGHDARNATAGTGGPRDAAILHTEESLRRGASALEVVSSGTLLRHVPGAERPAIDAFLIARNRRATPG